MADQTSVVEAQSQPETAPAGELTFTPESQQQAPLTTPLAEQFASLNAEQLQSVIEKLGGNAGPPPPGRLEDGDFQPPAEPAPAAPEAEATPAPDAVEAAPAEVPPVDPPADPVDNPPGRIRIDRIADERTRKILEFQSRNHDATIEDAIAFVDGQQQAQAPTPQAAPVGPDVATMQTRVAELTQKLKEQANPMRDGYDGAAVAELQSQLLDAKVDLRFAQDQANRQQASLYQQRADTRQTNLDTAIALCPEMNVEGTPQAQEFTRIYNAYAAKNDPILNNDEVAMLIALQVMHKTGYTPKSATPAPEAAPVTAKPAAPAPQVRTTVPVGRTALPAQTTAPGNARLTQASAPTRAQLEEALSTMDPSTLELVVAKAGEKLAPPAQPWSMA